MKSTGCYFFERRSRLTFMKMVGERISGDFVDDIKRYKVPRLIRQVNLALDALPASNACPGRAALAWRRVDLA